MPQAISLEIDELHEDSAEPSGQRLHNVGSNAAAPFTTSGRWEDGGRTRGVPRGEYLGDGPGLRDTAGGSERGVAGGDFGQRSDTVALQLVLKRFEIRTRRLGRCAGAQERRDPWPDEPTPYGALVIRAVTFGD